MVEFCVKVALYQISMGRYFIIENPLGSQLWNLACILRLAQERNATWDLLNLCAFGLKDPETGLYYQKGLYLMHNFPAGVLTPLFRKCKQDHEHQVLEGSVEGKSRASISEVYPQRFCRLLARLLHKFLYGHSHTRTSAFLIDVLYSVSLTDAEQNALSYFGQSRVSEPLPGTHFVASSLSALASGNQTILKNPTLTSLSSVLGRQPVGFTTNPSIMSIRL